ncbi:MULTISPECIES: glycoside hydrolase family 15 protein [unclassified Streptomyces]|uniref:glycoside hydrolase family 15 protein n=1 Tax=unclassified Streptomyces TaxID=2593676 RepID=UPI000B5960AC|nr:MULTISPECIES: glycoside hydrolase family 15 protein [unclassified Streptomyces]
MIGDLRTAALVGTDGGISWFCAPRFDSPSIFGSLLDAQNGGHWRISPVGEVAKRQQYYFPDINILMTRMLTENGIVEIQDFMPIRAEGDRYHRQRLVRRVVSVRGSARIRAVIAPRMNYGRDPHKVESQPHGVRFTSETRELSLQASVSLHAEGQDAVSEFDLPEGQSVLFVLESTEPTRAEPTRAAPTCAEPTRAQPTIDLVDAPAAEELFQSTVRFWRQWLSQSTYTGRWREMVHRSALTLKLLTHEPTGAIVAAPTLGLPEQVGGERNWDYRYVWIRDAAFSLHALLRLGFTREAQAFISWLTECLRKPRDGDRGPLRVLYSIDGDAALPEQVLDHWEGYRGSAPVRVGNGAADQLQLDIYGELFDSIYLFNKHGDGISHESWRDLCAILDWLLEHWDGPDAGIWETRAGQQRHTYSRVMCWVAVERMIRMARQRGLPGDVGRWMSERDKIYHQIMNEGWSAQDQTFVQRLSGDPEEPPEGILDASLLVLPMVKFLSPKDPRFRSTVHAISKGLVTDSLVFRYDPKESPDGLDGTEGTFSICSFWWVEALARTGRTDEARVALEKMFTYANHLGLYAEQIGMTGDHLGNFPQAFTHLALISAATSLDGFMGEAAVRRWAGPAPTGGQRLATDGWGRHDERP